VRPTPQQVDELFASLKILFQPDREREGRKPVEVLEHGLREALRRDLAGSVVPDGFPATSGGGGGTDVSRPTENAALSTYKPVHRDEPDGPHVQRPPKDVVHDECERAWAFLQEGVYGLRAALRSLDHIESVTGTARAPEMCNSCLQVGVHTPMALFSDVAGRLPRPYRLCMPCYDWIRKNETSGLPSIAYLERHHGVGMKGRQRVTNQRKAS
jgi:hypothetical protein